ncbi:S1/P1 nuclease [Roseococcus pinisoli]|uniref:S1/P1 nuclease n=1 Tax=Roseococcus pinisoli TaxID=2835040 RepID=A0ABS5QK33_9PROT|nr:S1/P1 nuclease [Roseococcus pinisoli]MBS7813773.1 S1/P1 nuclease [Roseococcus pinisoli]
MRWQAPCTRPFLRAHAWGIEGHEAIGLMAERHLRVDVATQVKALLASEGSKSLVEIANWADTINTREANGSRHTPRPPLDHSEANFSIVCEKRNPDATWGIEQQGSILANQTKTTAERMTALKYVVHLVGDTHQPMHASARIGNEPVMVGRRRTTPHKIWDTLIIRRMKLRMTDS